MQIPVLKRTISNETTYSQDSFDDMILDTKLDRQETVVRAEQMDHALLRPRPNEDLDEVLTNFSELENAPIRQCRKQDRYGH